MSIKAAFFPLVASLLFCFACEPAPTSSEGDAVDAATEMAAVVEVVEIEEVKGDTVAELWDHLAQVTLPKLPGELPDFSGTYQVSGLDGGYYFTVDLSQQSDTILGSYCGGTDNRSDCGVPSQGAGDCEVRGIVRQGVGYLVFRSCYMGTTGLAKIRKAGHHLTWETTEYPDSDGMMSFCAAPSTQVLIDKDYEIGYDFPARFDTVDISSANFMMDLNHADSQYICTDIRIYNDPEMKSFQTALHMGKPVKILEEAGDYMLSNYGDETFEAPIYKVAFEQYGQETIGYLYHEDLAQAHFTDNRGNLFLLCLEAEMEINNRDLEWRVLGESFGHTYVTAGFKVLNAKSNAYFPAYDFTIKDRKDLSYGNFSFFEMQVNTYGYEELRPVFLWAWNGKNLVPVLEPGSSGIPVGYEAKRNNNLLVINKVYRQSGNVEIDDIAVYEMGGEVLELQEAPEVDLTQAQASVVQGD